MSVMPRKRRLALKMSPVAMGPILEVVVVPVVTGYRQRGSLQLFSSLKTATDPLLAPDFVSSSPWMFQKGSVPLPEIRVHRQFASFNRSVVAIVQYRSRHSTKDR